MKNLFSKKKLVGFIICFLSAIFIQATSVNAADMISPVCTPPFNTDYFSNALDVSVIREDNLENYERLKTEYENNYKNFYDYYLIYQNKNNTLYLYLFNEEDLSTDKPFFNLSDSNRYTNRDTYIKLYFNKPIAALVISTVGQPISFYSGCTSTISMQFYLKPTEFPNYKIFIETNYKSKLVVDPVKHWCNTILINDSMYNLGDVIYDVFPADGSIDIDPKDNLKGIYNYSGKFQTNLEFVKYNFVIDNLNDNKFTFYLKDHMTKIKTEDLDYFELSYRNLTTDPNVPFIYIDSFSINDPYSFIKTRDINFDFIEFYFDSAEYREDLYFLNELLDKIEFKIKIIPKDNTKIQNLHLLDSFDTYNSSLDYYLIPKKWKVNNKNYNFDYFTSGFIQGSVSELDNLKEINLPPGVNKVFLYSNTDTLSTVIGYDLTNKRRLYNYSLSEQKIISTVNNFEILDSFNTKWENLYKIEKNIYNDDIFYLELLDIHSLGYTLWVSQNVEYNFFIDKTIVIKDVEIDNVANPDRQEIIDIDNNLSHFKKGFSAVNILYGTFYNNLTAEFKFLHNFLITLMILSVVFWVVML